ncbi:hypothetical protein ACSCBZ_39300 [Streptomyces niveiscabiei]|uniref:hypothetical protein n=1 Tax=Streptomyces niveiscabiei TaxID=164115 RepID=UPI000AD32680|nr:hypothetical protein [Streptomyces niveiscabiei]
MTSVQIPSEPFGSQKPQPVPNPNPDCARCGELAQERAEAAKARDLSRVTDCNVRIATHATGHNGTPSNHRSPD